MKYAHISWFEALVLNDCSTQLICLTEERMVCTELALEFRSFRSLLLMSFALIKNSRYAPTAKRHAIMKCNINSMMLIV